MKSEIEQLWDIGLTGAVLEADIHLTKQNQKNKDVFCSICESKLNSYSSCFICPNCGNKECGAGD